MSLKDVCERLQPLKTLHETRSNDQYVEALVFEIPAKLASKAISIVKPVIQESSPKQPGLHHLRKLIHLPHLPKDLLERRLVVTRPNQPSVFLIQVATQDLADAMLTALKTYMDEDPVLVAYNHLPRCFPIPVPLYAPLSEQQAKLWSERHWPSIYNPASQVLQDAPPMQALKRVMTELDTVFTDNCIELAKLAAKEAAAVGYGRPIGALVVDPESKQVVAVAGDARWIDCDEKEKRKLPNGRPEYHAVMRVISMVANKELRRRLAVGRHIKFADSCSEARSGQPLYPIEEHYLQDITESDTETSLESTFNTLSLEQHTLPPVQTDVRGEGYLCSNLDLYLTHEPCVCCTMAMVHSRFRSCTFVNRLSKTGALAAKIDKHVLGYGLFWRRELNWRVMTFQYKQSGQKKQSVSNEAYQA